MKTDASGALAPAAFPAVQGNVAIAAENLGIQFLKSRKRKARIRDVLLNKKDQRPSNRKFWAVRNVTMTIAPGESVGLIGENGSGKSTLLKLVAGVLVPDEGSITIGGEVAPLLQLGAGFAAELTGRENIWLSGAIHGIPREDMADRFDDIVRYAGPGVRDFLDTPVRHYSSGMKVRLGFSIVAQLDHPIMLIDEVLAVGDRRFKRRCYRRIEELVASGRTLVIVSHSRRHIERFCDRAVYMRHGEMVMDGPPAEVFKTYDADTSGDD